MLLKILFWLNSSAALGTAGINQKVVNALAMFIQKFAEHYSDYYNTKLLLYVFC